ncbi:hypothetical protein FIV09_14255 [Roseivivax sp. THAF197b]|nr:hypothetical protein FIV09_14255 [Roseivivax sp. THAF197b]
MQLIEKCVSVAFKLPVQEVLHLELGLNAEFELIERYSNRQFE